MKGVFFMSQLSKIKKLVLSALLLAITIVLSRFLSINTELLAIGFSFVPMMLTAIWLGPKYSTVVCGLADLIGALLFPFGTFFIGFTISAVLKGLIYGLVLYEKDREFTDKELLIRLIISSLIVIIFVNILLNAVWLKIMYDKAFIAILSLRTVAQFIMLPIQVLTVYALVKALKPITKKYLSYQE